MNRLKPGMASNQKEKAPPTQPSSAMPDVRKYHGTQVIETGAAESHKPHRRKSHQRLVNAMVNPGTSASAQALPRVNIATDAIMPNVSPSAILPVFANRAKQRALTSIPRVTRCSVVTRTLDSCTRGDIRNNRAANIPAQRAIKRLPVE